MPLFPLSSSYLRSNREQYSRPDPKPFDKGPGSDAVTANGGAPASRESIDWFSRLNNRFNQVFGNVGWNERLLAKHLFRNLHAPAIGG